MKRLGLVFLTLLFLGIIVAFFSVPANRAFLYPGEVRAAIDIGSGSTNLKVAKVDPKTDKITIQLFEKSIPVAYQKHLEQSFDQTFDKEVMHQGMRTIKELKQIADDYQVKKVVAVATAAFRKAKNGNDFAKEIEKVTNVKDRIINQDEEGVLAFKAAVANTDAKPEDVVIWDIGGGSMQLTTLDHQGRIIVDKGKTASTLFKNAVIGQIKGENLKITHSPNPMSLDEMQKAINYAASLSQSTSTFMKQKLQDPDTKIFAVGSLFNYGIKPLVNTPFLQREDLEQAVKEYTGKSDAELPGGSLAEVAVTNPLLVIGYMNGLNIQHLEILNVNNADGALTNPPYWE